MNASHGDPMHVGINTIHYWTLTSTCDTSDNTISDVQQIFSDIEKMNHIINKQVYIN